MINDFIKIHTFGTTAELKAARGHFATNHAHVNYFLDTTTIKARTSDAQELAKSLVNMYLYNTTVDTIICLEGTEVIGAFLGEELKRNGFRSLNTHDTTYVIKPEFNNNSQMIFRDNVVPMIRGKNVIVLTASMTTGISTRKAMESISYYGGHLVGISAIFSITDSIDGVPVRAVFSKKDIPDYMSCDYRDCPLCKAGKKLDALVNHFGYSNI